MCRTEWKVAAILGRGAGNIDGRAKLHAGRSEFDSGEFIGDQKGDRGDAGRRRDTGRRDEEAKNIARGVYRLKAW